MRVSGELQASNNGGGELIAGVDKIMKTIV
jgi:hypothetical protein